MKRYLSFFLALIIVLSVLSSNVFAAATAFVEDEELISVVDRPYTKILTNEAFPSESITTGNVNMARNETEGIQISLTAPSDKKNLSVRVNNSYSGIDTEVFYYEFISANGADYPDPLVPLSGMFDVPKDKVFNLIINFTASSSAQAGTYTYDVDILNYTNTIIKTFRFTVTVYDITYPETPTLNTTIGIEWRSIAYSMGITSDPGNYDLTEEQIEQTRPYYKLYYDYLLERKMSPSELPYDILDPRADAYMSDPRVTAFMVPSNVDDETLVQIYDKLRTNEEWISKAYIYPLDEPKTVEDIDAMIAYSEKYKELCPRLRLATSFFTNVNYNNDKDLVAALGDILGIMSAKTAAWNGDDSSYGIADSAKYGSFADRMNGY